MRVTRVKVGNEWLQVESAPSPPVTVFVRDVFPPALPAGLAAVPISAVMNGGRPEVDLSWSANTEPDMAQYLIFRRDIGAETSSNLSVAERIGPENSTTPVVVPAFRDRHVQPGHTYAYWIIAVDNAGNKSQSSKEVVITVPRL
jgi:fibronectin type 3 domain-containing protein